MSAKGNYKCNFCKICNGKGCIGQLPGMGGTNDNENFILNCQGWSELREKHQLLLQDFFNKSPENRIPKLCIAPMTGAVENLGFETEEAYYSQIINAIHQVGVGLCIGDGFPDDKLKFGIKALKKISKTDSSANTSVFIKPYSNSKIIERLKWAQDCTKIAGIDIDSYNILTMRHKVQLEKKTTDQLKAIKSEIKIPFAVKGIFLKEDIELLKEVKPEIAYVSNHGGRIETRKGSTADFLANYASEIKKYCGELWVDGGIRSPLDVATAMALGADRVLIGRPFASALCHGGSDELCKKVLELSLLQYAY